MAGAAPLLPMAGRDWKASARAALPPSTAVDGYPSFKDLTPDAVSIEIGELMPQLTALVGGGTLNP